MSPLSRFSTACLFAAQIAVAPAASAQGGGAPATDPALVFSSNGSLYVCNGDGSGVRLLLAGASTSALLAPAWSPDGMQVVFNGRMALSGGYQSGIYAIERSGANLRLLVPLTSGADAKPAWSPSPAPDGQYKIAFTAPVPGTAGSRELFVVNPDGSALQQLTATPAAEYQLAWTRDGHSLVVVDLDLPGISLQDCYALELGLDGSGRIAIAQRRELLNVPGSPLRPAWHSSTIDIAWPDCARTQDKLALAALNVAGGSGWDLWIIDLASPALAARVPGAKNVHERQPSWSPNDAFLAHWNSKGGIRAVRPDGTGLVALISGGMLPDWRR